MRAWLRMACVVVGSFTSVLLAQQPDAPSVPTDVGWPRQVQLDGRTLLIYQPQIDVWDQDKLSGIVALAVEGAVKTQPVYGTAALTAETRTNPSARTVTIDNIQSKSVQFPAAGDQRAALEQSVGNELASLKFTMSLDRLLSNIAITHDINTSQTRDFKSTPPEIIISQVPAVLILIDGDPQLRQISGTSLMRVINTPWVIVLDPDTGQYYLQTDKGWMSSTDIMGSWAKTETVPQVFASIPKDDLVETTQQDWDDAAKPDANPAPGDAAPPRIIVRTRPAELIVIDGDPQYTPIEGTELLYVSNTRSDVFLQMQQQKMYLLIGGRWFTARTLQGPWASVDVNQLPSDFSKIPADSPKADALVSVPGTDQAKAAVVAAQIPQTATIDRSQAKLDVQYDGAPKFEPITGTKMQYAVNTNDDVVQTSDTRYYCCNNGVWFVATAASGPWVVADSVPPEIYTIPPSCRVYRVTYCYTYNSTPQVVYVGYTPGYLGTFVWGPTVVYGTGWTYPAWYGAIYCGGPWTWGFNFSFNWYAGGFVLPPWYNHYWWHHGWLYHHYWWHHNWRHHHWGPYGPLYQHHWQHAVVDHHDHFDHHKGPIDTPTDKNHGQKHDEHRDDRPSDKTDHGLITPHREPPAASGRRDDLYAGHDANVYRRNEAGAWERYQNDGWRREQDWSRPYAYRHENYGFDRPAWDRGWSQDRWRERPTQYLNDEYRARHWGGQRYSGFRAGGYRGGGGWHGGGRR